MPTPIDILNRQPFVESLIDIVRKVADSGRGCTFSLDGQWGCGKTFILDMFEREISLFQHPDACGDRYLLFRYNCWEYDYYDEPTIAMVAAIKDDIDSKKKLLPTTSKQAKAILKVAQKLGVDLLNSAIEKKLGIKSAELMKRYSDAVQGVEAKEIKDTSFDSYFSFKTALNQARSELQKLAMDKPIIFLVDELDRCLPEYAIKVLERLHHLLDGIPNIIVILAVDGRQLDNTVKKIYGNNANTNQYLRKFISFNLKLTTGTIGADFWQKHSAYLSLFCTPSKSEHEFLNGLVTNLFIDIDVRTQEKIIDRAMTLHMLTFQDSVDISLLYFELIHQVVSQRCPADRFQVWLLNISNFSSLDIEQETNRNFNTYMAELEKAARTGQTVSTMDGNNYYDLSETPIGLAYWYLANLGCPAKKNVCGKYFFAQADKHQHMIANIKSFDNLSQIIK